MIDKILEGKQNLAVYKRLIWALGDYSDKFPATGVDQLFNKALEHGVKVVPTDKKAMEILSYIQLGDSIPTIVNNLLNLRFSDLPAEYRPMYRAGSRKLVAFWGRAGQVYDKVVSLIDFNGKASSGGWVDVDGNKIKLLPIDTSPEANGGDK